MRYVLTAVLTAAFFFLSPAWSQTPMDPSVPQGLLSDDIEPRPASV